MNSDLETAFCGVYSSSREIIKNKQRHLYCNMLDLLTTTCKATAGCPVTKISNNEQVQFWCNEILPLVFEKDAATQNSAMGALEQGLLKSEMVACVHSSTHWPSIRQTIVTLHLPKIAKMLEQKNPQWHIVWCLLVRLLDSEILRTANTINSFLSIVELAFRSSEIQIRIEAFACWRLLIKIFTAHGDIFLAKRLKLISIPLKSSQSKSAEAAVVKLRVWWYLLTCLGSRLCEEFTLVVGNFLTFTLGTCNVQGAAQQYSAVRELMLPCFTALLTTSPETAAQTTHSVERLLREHRLEPFTQSSPLADFASLEKNRQPVIVAATLEAVRLLVQRDAALTEAEQLMLEQLLRYLLNPLLCLAEPAFATQICGALKQLLPLYPRPAVFVIGAIATEGLQWCNASHAADDYADVLDALLQLISAAKTVVPPAILQRCIEQVFALKVFGSGRNRWRAFLIVLDLIAEPPLGGATAPLYETRLLVWQTASASMLEYLCENSLDCRLKEYAQVLNRWTLWPLTCYAAKVRASAATSFDANFCSMWRRLLPAGQNSPDRLAFLDEVQKQLQALLPLNDAESVYFAELLHSYAAEVLKLDGVKDVKQNCELLALLKALIAPTASAKSLELYMNVFRMLIATLNDNELFALSETLKATLLHIVQVMKKQALDKSYQTEWRGAITERLRAHSNKKFGAQLCALLKNNRDNEFVVIPSVWSLNPEKLTDRQKERFREKADIPALYNDMSHSQESASIKPWTPNKIVAAKTIDKVAIASEQRSKEQAVVSEQPTAIAKPAELSGRRETRRQTRRSPRLVLEEPTTSASAGSAIAAQAEVQMEAGSETQPAEADTEQLAVLLVDEPAAEILAGDELCSSASPNSPEPKSPEPKSPGAKSPEAKSPDPQQAAALVTTAVDHGDLRCLENAVEVLQEAAKLDREAFNPTVELLMDQRIMLPKRNFARHTSLSSPPDRRLTNNTTSPTLRPKPSAHLTGRGAQLINMIRNRSKTDLSITMPNQSNGTPTINNATPRSCLTPAFPRIEKNDSSGGTPLPQCAEAQELPPEHTSTPIQPRDLLVFSRTLPSQHASPSTSILKRKLRSDSVDEFSIESPIQKRKRVSFHDPPVSLTKEYLRDADENRARLKRCLNMDRAVTETKLSSLKRQNKLDGIAQIENCTVGSEKCDDNMAVDLTQQDDDDAGRSSTAKDLWPSVAEKNTAETSSTTTFDLAQVSVDTLLNYVVQKHPIESLLDKYCAIDKANATQKLPSTLAKYISQSITDNPKVKTNVLEILSENHSKDFLDHAIQENLSSVVCDRLNLNSVMDYICAKSKINANCRSSLFAQLPDIIKQCKASSGQERLNCVRQLLQGTDLSDEEILDLIALLVHKRNETERNAVAVSASESAVDSSSNL